MKQQRQPLSKFNIQTHYERIILLSLAVSVAQLGSALFIYIRRNRFENPFMNGYSYTDMDILLNRDWFAENE
jgi:hypothetical protein